ncbi:MAG TPA: LON peptidase substrate-binding domain-containing protein, partial [Polyangiaceae bacterium]|nr:LON peptidase substrate-binding domain-containing protein [Polyangiaceae bacterium]
MAHARESSDPKGALDMPDELPVLPLVEAVVFPLTIAPAPVDVTSSRKLVEDAMKGNRLVLLVAMREGDPRRPRAEDLYAYGTAAVVHDAVMGPDAVLRVAVEGLERARIVDWVRSEPYLVARAQRARDLVEHGSDLDVLLRSARQLFLRFVSLVTELSSELAATVNRVTDPRQLVYLLASTTPMTTEARQLILEQPSVVAKLRKTIEHLQHDIAVRELMQSIAGEASAKAATSVTTAEREALLRKQRDTLPRDPLGEHEGDHAAARGLRGQIGRLELPDDARREIERELDRLERTPAASPEHGMIRTYLDWVLKLPWGKASGGAIDVGVARAVLDADHHGLTKVKERIVEYLAVRRLRAERGAECATDVDASREPILCFVGPPGVGKTSLGQSIA